MRDYVLREPCVSSDSGMKVGKCWCAECADVRREVRRERKVLAVYQVEPSSDEPKVFRFTVVTD